MKKKKLNITIVLLLILITILVPKFIKAQVFTMSELEVLSSKNWDEFDTYLIKKGYVYNNYDTDKYSELKTYSFQRNVYSGAAPYWITLCKYLNNNIGLISMISWQTNEVNDYIKIKDQLKVLGYVSQNTEIFDGKTVIYYKKLNKEVLLIVGKKLTTDGKEITSYEISLNINEK